MTIVDGMIVAGGRSSRMGQDKALLCWQDRPLLRHVAQLASRCCRHIYIISPWPERYREIADPHWQLLLETQPNQGPLSGFHQGLVQVKNRPNPPEWILLLACDLPLLEESILRNWMLSLSQISSEQLALVPREGDRWEPLCGWYRLSCLSSLTLAIQQGQRSFQVWLDQISTEPIEIEATAARTRRMLWNCNTPEDFEQIRYEKS